MAKLCLAVSAARHLPDLDVSSAADTYFTVTANSEQVFRSATVEDSANPSWTHTPIEVDVDALKGAGLVVRLLNDNMLSDDGMGSLTVDPSKVPRSTTAVEGEWLPLQGKNYTVEIKLAAWVTPKPGQATGCQDGTQKPAAATKEPTPPAARALRVTVLAATNLPSTDVCNSTDCYIKLFWGSSSARSATIHNCAEPQWTADNIFELQGKPDEPLLVEAWDDDFGTDEPLGKAAISLGELRRDVEHEIDQTLRHSKGYAVSVKLRLTALNFDGKAQRSTVQATSASKSGSARKTEATAAKSTSSQQAGTSPRSAAQTVDVVVKRVRARNLPVGSGCTVSFAEGQSTVLALPAVPLAAAPSGENQQQADITHEARR